RVVRDPGGPDPDVQLRHPEHRRATRLDPLRRPQPGVRAGPGGDPPGRRQRAVVRYRRARADGVQPHRQRGGHGDRADGAPGPGEVHPARHRDGAGRFGGVPIKGGVITDPIGPQPKNAITAPQYQDTTQPTSFLYPDGTKSTDPYLWLSWFRI